MFSWWLRVSGRSAWFILCLLLVGWEARPLAAEGRRLPARASAQKSAAGHGPELAVDLDESTLWIASLKPGPENNHVWFQLDLGSVKPVARLHWLAAQGSPYPASAPKDYRVLLSTDGKQWRSVPVPRVEDESEPNGSVLLNANARYVRLETTKINDGTGWSLGLREIWVTEGRDHSIVARQFRPRVTAEDGAVRLAWTIPAPFRAARVNLYRADAPKVKTARPLVTLPAHAREYRDPIPNWTPRYYRVDAVDARGRILLTSDLAAAIARPSAPASGYPAAAPVETFAFWYEPYRPRTDAHASLTHIGSAAFVVGPGMEAAADLARAGKGLLPYVTFYQTAGWAGSFPKSADPQKVAVAIAPIAFYRRSVRFPDSPPGYVPSVFCRPDNVEYNPRSIQYTTCPNSLPFRRLVLAHIRRQLEGGALGFFVDNGYDDDVAARSVCESTHHEHYYGDHLTSADAFLGLLLEVSCQVKRRHPTGIVMVNGGVPAHASFYGLTLGDVCDGQLWESYLRSSYSTPKEHVSDWQSVYRRSVDLERAWHATPPRRMFALSYPWDRDEAYFCYCTAKLCLLPWSASLGISDPNHRHFGGHFGTYPELIDLRLGPPLHEREYGGTQQGEIYYREYERGVVVVNPTADAQSTTLPLGLTRRYRDVYSQRDAAGDSLALQLPAESGRVFLWEQ